MRNASIYIHNYASTYTRDSLKYNNQCPSKYMPDNQPLLNQLANRCRKWHDHTGITQSQMAEALGMADSNYSAFLSGRKGIGSESTCLLLQLTALPRRQAVARFSMPVRSSRIMELQEKGEAMYFDNSGWTAHRGTGRNSVEIKFWRFCAPKGLWPSAQGFNPGKNSIKASP
jgi:transcriptional regulator with XRE-family HTH domain